MPSHLIPLLLFVTLSPLLPMKGAEFREIPEETIKALKAAQTSEQWAELMPEAEMFTYAKRGDQAMPLYFFPSQLESDAPTGVLLLFSGGAFKSGSPAGYYRHALDYSANGMAVVLVKYRGTKTDNATVLDAYRDGHAALVWVRDHAEELGIDPDKVVAGGSSAGSMIALALATLDFLQEKGGATDGAPNGLLLYDLAMGAIASAPIEGDPMLGAEPPARWSWFSEERFGDDPKKLSPFHHLHDDLPPAALFMGGKEKPAQRHGAWLLFSAGTEKGADWDLHFYGAMPHGSMTGSAGWQPEVYRSVVESSLRFLRRHEFLTN